MAVCLFKGNGPSPAKGSLAVDIDMAGVGDPWADLRSGRSRAWKALSSGKHLMVWEVSAPKNDDNDDVGDSAKGSPDNRMMPSNWLPRLGQFVTARPSISKSSLFAGL